MVAEHRTAATAGEEAGIRRALMASAIIVAICWWSSVLAFLVSGPLLDSSTDRSSVLAGFWTFYFVAVLCALVAETASLMVFALAREAALITSPVAKAATTVLFAAIVLNIAADALVLGATVNEGLADVDQIQGAPSEVVAWVNNHYYSLYRTPLRFAYLLWVAMLILLLLQPDLISRDRWMRRGLWLLTVGYASQLVDYPAAILNWKMVHYAGFLFGFALAIPIGATCVALSMRRSRL